VQTESAHAQLGRFLAHLAAAGQGRPRRFLLGVFTAVALVAGWSTTRAGDPPVIEPRRVVPQDIGTRFRVFARPGDALLENTQATAVIRRRDGWLVDFWRNRPILPTAEQLGATTDIDGLWKLYQVLVVGGRTEAFLANQVTRLADGVRTDSQLELGGTVYYAATTYRLDPTRPRLTIVTELSTSGKYVNAPVGIGDAFKWGNVEYRVDGVLLPRMKYKGPARWIGRHGAGGDLLLRTLEHDRMRVRYGAVRRGFQGTITAVYQRAVVPNAGMLRVARELSYEPLPIPAPAPPRALGTLQLEVVDEQGRGLPAKVKVSQPGVKRRPFPDDGGLLGADRFMWTGNGKLTRQLPPGRYRLLFTAGIERDAHSASVEVQADRVARVQAQLPRVISTPGWIAADLHLHQAPSIDADISLPMRVIAVAAEGVEFAVPTDHFVVTDLGPTIRWLRREGILSSPLLTVPGTEVSTIGHRFGHFNVFPLRTAQNVVYRDTTADELFADARRQSPEGVLQVNHPRWGKTHGYFTHFGKSENSARMSHPGFNANFDTVEVYNGDDARDLKRVRRVLRDWMHLLGDGHRYAATGSSDSHKLAFLDPGLPRTLIRHQDGGSDEQDRLVSAQRVIAALKAGRVQVTSGPVIDARVAGKGPGDTALGVGRSTKLHVTVRAAPWVNVAQVEVLQGGAARQVHWARVPRSRKVLRFDRDFDLKVTGSTFVVVVAQGSYGLPNTSRDHIVPFAFTNAIFVEP
jgi:hypothetical protein